MNVTRLTKVDLAAIEARVNSEVAALGTMPTIDELRAEGHHENTALNAALDAISGAGRVITLLIAELIQSGAVLMIGAFFAVLEYNRLLHGAIALGQADDQAALIAIAFVVANVVHPIYSLRALRGQQAITVQRGTLRGYLSAFWRRLVGLPTVEERDAYHNPTLHVAAAVITWATVFLAVFDVLQPIITTYSADGVAWYASIGQLVSADLSTTIQLVAGLMLSIGGVFFLQSAAHEIGVRTLTDQPTRLADVLDQRRAAYAEQVAAIRARVTHEHMAGKIADSGRTNLLPNLAKSDHDSEPLAVLKNGAKHYTEADWTPTPESYLCACGCGEMVTWSGIGRRTKYVNDSHKIRAARARNGAKA